MLLESASYFLLRKRAWLRPLLPRCTSLNLRSHDHETRFEAHVSSVIGTLLSVLLAQHADQGTVARSSLALRPLMVSSRCIAPQRSKEPKLAQAIREEHEVNDRQSNAFKGCRQWQLANVYFWHHGLV